MDLGNDDDHFFIHELTEEQREEMDAPDIAYKQEDIVMVQLLNLLTTLGCPLNAFDRIMEWAQEAVQRNYKFPVNAPKRETYMERLIKRFHMGDHLPEVVSVDLVTTDVPKVDVVRYDFRRQLMSLLMDPELMKLDNLDVNPNDPFGNAFIPNRKIDDVHSGSWYRDTYKKEITDKGLTNTILIPIILYMDKTKIDRFQHFGLEPCSMTTTLLKRKIRNKPQAWRHLGFLYDFQRSEAEGKIMYRKNKAYNMQNVHRQLHKILESFIETQKDERFQMDIRIGDTVRRMRVIVPLAFVIGDCQGQDKLCGAFAAKTNTVRISRACDCTYVSSDDPTVQCQMRIQNDMQGLIEEDDEDELKYWSMREHDNVFFQMNLGANPEGIYGATPIDCTHAHRHGLVKYILEVFFKHLNPKEKSDLDRMTRKIHIQARQSGAKNGYPRTTFTHGITSLSFMTHAEKIGCITVLVLILAQEEGREIVLQSGKYLQDHDMVLDWLHVFELLLAFDAWTHDGIFWRLQEEDNGDVPQDELNCLASIVQFLETLRDIADREAGNGWKISKFHEQLHLAWYITRFGSPMNYDSGRCEYNHKPLCKDPGKTAQKRHFVFTEQVGKRVTVQLLIDRAMKKWGLFWDPDDDPEEPNNSFRATRFYVFRRRNNFGAIVEGYTFCRKGNRNAEIVIDDETCEYVLQNFLAPGEIGKVHCSTECNKKGVVYRSHPNYRTEGKPWMDWVSVRFSFDGDEEDRNYTSKIMCFVQDPRDDEVKGVVHCTDQNINLKETVLTNTWTLEMRHQQKVFRTVELDTFDGHSFAFPTSNHEVVVLKPHDKWASLFQEYT